jgi:uncharacterized protein
MHKIIVFGGTGFLGLSLANHLQPRGYEIILVARNTPKKNIPFTFCTWDGVSVGSWKEHFTGQYTIVNLAGRSVDCIKNPDNCDLILRSRVDSTKAIGEALRQSNQRPRAWIQMSTAHIYGDPPFQVMDESSSYGYGLAPFVAQAWEKAFEESVPDQVRAVVLRTSFVLGRAGGALNTLKMLTRLGLGGKVGSGKQGISWIHEFDMNEIFRAAIEDPNYSGTYIATAPNPVSHQAFMRQLRKSLKFPFGIPSPEWLVRIGSKLFFKTDPELIIYGRYIVPSRLMSEGFAFQFASIQQALDDLA